jgi:hypothetical protein
MTLQEFPHQAVKVARAFSMTERIKLPRHRSAHISGNSICELPQDFQFAEIVLQEA